MYAHYLSPFAAVLALIYVALSMYVVRLRTRARQAIGTGNDPLLERAVRAHANFAEYTPITLILLWLMLSLSLPHILVSILAFWFTFARLLHAYSILVAEPRFHNYRYRMAAMISTFSVLTIAAISILVFQLTLWLE